MEAAQCVRIGQATFDKARAELSDAAGKRVPLRPQSLQVFEVLLNRAGQVVSRDVLHQEVWPDVVVTEDSLVQCIGEIRRAIGDAGHEVLRTVARRGYLLEVPSPADADPAVWPRAMPPTLAPSSPKQTGSARLSRLRAFWPALMVLGLAMLAIVWWRLQSAEPASDGFGARPALAVLAFHGDLADTSGAALGASIAEELIGDLARDVDLPVVSARSSFALDAQNLSATEVARRLNVRYLVDGSVRRDGERLRLQVQLIDGSNSRVVWTDTSEASVDRLAAQRADLISRIGGSIGSSMRWNQKEKALVRPPVSLDVYALTLRAYASKHRYTAASYRSARADLDEALRLDPGHAPAWAVLAYVNVIDIVSGITGDRKRGQIDDVLAQINRAIQLDPALPLAHQAHAVVLSAAGRYGEALTAAETAVELAPGDADNRAVLARAQYEAGRTADARRTMDGVLPLYPIEPTYISSWDAGIRWAQGDLEGAIAKTGYCIARTPGLLSCRTTRATALFEKGRLDEARSEADAIRAQATGATRALFVGTVAGVPELKARRLKAAEALGFGG
jgi:TolB-like protein/DNA-binding winged helix-turn-helix (wHTH) protein